jgi:hypothetical protein
MPVLDIFPAWFSQHRWIRPEFDNHCETGRTRAGIWRDSLKHVQGQHVVRPPTR